MTSWLRSAWGRLRTGWPLVAQVTLAATASWFVASRLLGGGDNDSGPFFAPAAALIVLAQSRGVRLRKAVQVLIGIAVGALTGEVAIEALGARSTAAIFVVVLVAVGLSVAAGAAGVVRNQLTMSALFLVAVVPPGNQEVAPTRFYDALIGGSIALLISQIAVGRSPLAPLETEGRQAFTELSGVVDGIRQALRRHDEQTAQAVFDRARQLDSRTEALRRAVLVAEENLRLAPWDRHSRPRIQAVRAAVDHVDYAVRNIRTLARLTVTVTRLPDPVPTQLGTALTALHELTTCAAAVLVAVVAGDRDTADQHVDRAGVIAVDTARAMTPLLRHEQPLPVSTMIGQLRMAVLDLLRSAGADRPEVLDAIDEALDLPPVWRQR
ncbi:FUSC family protein [Micromonospora sp. NPDC005413]|uniref:FUSC family protein n=1 Tax=Micromonospora sp. NPDC005413 TaxID=3154563 RepID=UPI0033A3B6BB